MANIVDSMIITLGLDPAEFTKGRKKAAAEMVKMKSEAVQHAKDIEGANRKTADAFNKMRNEALAFFSVLTGVRSVKDFVANLTNVNTQLGYLATNLGESPQMLQAWGNAVERMGGNSADAASSIGNIAKAFFDLKNNGKALPDSIYRVFAMAGKEVDTTHGLDKFLNDAADALQKLAGKDRTAAFFFGKGMGLTDDMVNLMIRYGSATTAHVQALQGLSASDKAIAAAQKITEEFAKFQQQTVALGNTLYEQLGPTVADLLDKMSAWVDKNKEWLSTKITEAVQQLVEYIRQIDWESVKNGLSGFASEASGVVDAINKVISVTKTLLEMWGVSKVAGIPGAVAVGTARAADALGVTQGINKNVPGAGSIDDWFYRHTGGWIGTSAAAQQWYRENPGKEFTGDNADFNAHPEKYLKGPLPGRAIGGPVQSGRAYMVGENGPEPFIPGSNGTVLPNSILGGDIKYDGRKVNRANPLPVSLFGNGGETGGKSLLEMLFGKSSQDGGYVVGANDNPGRPNSSGAHSATSPGGSSGPGRHTSGTFKKNQLSAYRAARAAGLSETAARALVANFSGESLRRPNDHHWDVHHMSQGIAQWDPQRAEAIKRQFGKYPKDMTVEEQVTASIWEMKNNPSYAKSWNALNSGQSAEQMIDTLVRNYERPANPGRSIRDRNQFLGGFNPSEAWSGGGYPSGIPIAGAALSTTTNNHPVTTSSTSNSMHVDNISVNAPQAKDAHGIAGSIMQALADFNMAAMANSGQV